MSIVFMLLVIALLLTLARATGKIPLWPAVFVLVVALLIEQRGT